ncbi:MAG: hypothetical protein KGL02_07740 [Acidobacteriota bacterium]|nr:hypothetical protein [Acidobacteriota bacterium]
MAFRTFDQILRPDSRFETLVRLDFETGNVRQLTLKDHYDIIAEIELTDSLPEAVRMQFDKARNAFLYAWFDYELLNVAQGFAYAATEFALRVKIAGSDTQLPRSPGLKRLFKQAIMNGWVTDEGFRRVSKREIQNGYTAQLPNILSYLRNEFTHGSHYILPPGSAISAIEISANIINQLFEKRSV